MTHLEYKRVRKGKLRRMQRDGWEVVGPASAFGVYTVRKDQPGPNKITFGERFKIIFMLVCTLSIFLLFLQTIVK